MCSYYRSGPSRDKGDIHDDSVGCKGMTLSEASWTRPYSQKQHSISHGVQGAESRHQNEMGLDWGHAFPPSFLRQPSRLCPLGTLKQG